MSLKMLQLMLHFSSLVCSSPTAASFMCYTKTMGEDDTSVTFCSSGTCYSVGGSVSTYHENCVRSMHTMGCSGPLFLIFYRYSTHASSYIGILAFGELTFS